MNYAGCVRPEEMNDCQAWLSRALAALRDPAAATPQAEVRLVQQGWGKLEVSRAVCHSPLCLHGTVYTSGLGTHADSEIVVTLPGPAMRLTGLAGIDDNPGTRLNTKPLVFSVECGGREVWRSGPQAAEMPPARVDVDLAGQRAFTLHVRGPYNWGHANWVNLQVVLADGRVIAIGEPAQQGQCVDFMYNGRLHGAGAHAHRSAEWPADRSGVQAVPRVPGSRVAGPPAQHR